MEPWHYLLLALVGAVAGYINVMAGGGSLLTLPLMVFMGIPGPVANGSNRIAILLQNCSSVLAFRKRGFSDLKLSLSLAVVALPGTILGALAGVRIEGPWFNRVLAGVMVMVLLAMRAKKGNHPPPDNPEPLSRQRLVWGHVCMFGIGLYVGFIQAGVGFLLMAVLHRVMRMDLVRVNMHKVTIVGLITIAALVIYALNGKILWHVGLCLAAGQSAGAWIGTHSAVDHGEKLIRAVLKIAILVMAIRLMWTSF